MREQATGERRGVAAYKGYREYRASPRYLQDLQKVLTSLLEKSKREPRNWKLALRIRRIRLDLQEARSRLT